MVFFKLFSEEELEDKSIEKSYEERKKEWLSKVYRGGKEKEITFRGIVLGLIIGAILSLSNLYVGFKTGWSLGVTITAAIMSFALFKTLRKILPFLIKKDMGILELNILQTTSSACAFIASAGLVSAVPALLMVSGKSLTNFYLILWVMTILYLGLFMAIPMKRQMIDVEDLKFPTGFATSEVLHGMYAKGEDALKKARGLFTALGVGVVIAWLRDGIVGYPIFVKGKILKSMGIWQWKRILPSIPATFGLSSLSIMSIPLTRLTLSFEGSFIMMGAGAIMGIRAGASLLLGALIGYGILTPIAIHRGDIVHEPPTIVSSYSFSEKAKIYSSKDLVLPFKIKKNSVFSVLIEEDGKAPLIVARRWDRDTVFKKKSELLDNLNSVKTESGESNPFYEKIKFSYDSVTNRLFIASAGNCEKNTKIKVIEKENPFDFPVDSEGRALRYPFAFPAETEFLFRIAAAEGAEGVLKEEILRLKFDKETAFNNEEELLGLLNSKSLNGRNENPFFGKLSFSVSTKGYLSVKAGRLTKWDAEIESLEGKGNDILGFRKGQKNRQNYGGFKNIVRWLMWPGVAMMVAAGLLSFFMQWKTVLRAFKGLSSLFKGKNLSEVDETSRVDIPPSWFVSGFFAFGVVATFLQIYLFGITWWMGILAVLMTFFLAIVACRATGETDITPVGAMGKITQLLYGAIAPGNMVANLMTANVTGGAATSSADLLQSLKCGYRIGASPRKQFLAMMLGVIGGAVVCVPVYNILIPNADVIGTDKLPAPAAQTWAGVAILLSKGLSALPLSARWGLLWGAIFGIVVTLVERKFPKLRNYLPSPTAMGIAFVIPAFNSVSMFVGALIAYLLEKRKPELSENFTVPVASGLIAGESIMGILVAILIAFQFM